MPDGDGEVRSDEHVDFPELDLLRRVEVAGGSQHNELDVAVAFQFRPLVAGERVLDREVV